MCLGIRDQGEKSGPVVRPEAFHHIAPMLQRFLRPSRVVQCRSPVHQCDAKRFCRLRRTARLEAPDRFFPRRERFSFPLQSSQHIASVDVTARYHLPKDRRIASRVAPHNPVERGQRLLQPARLEERRADVRKRRGHLFDDSERVAPPETLHHGAPGVDCLVDAAQRDQRVSPSDHGCCQFTVKRRRTAFAEAFQHFVAGLRASSLPRAGSTYSARPPSRSARSPPAPRAPAPGSCRSVARPRSRL